MLSGKMAKAIYDTYQKLGPDWLLKIAQDKPDLFCSVFLQRLLPPALKDPADDSPLVNIAFNGDPIEQARRIAFALAKGVAASEDAQAEVLAERKPYVHLAPEDMTPQEACRADPGPDPLREQWAQTVAMSPEERLNTEDIDAHTNRKAFADSPPRPSWMDAEKPAGRPFVGIPRSKRDLL